MLRLTRIRREDEEIGRGAGEVLPVQVLISCELGQLGTT